MQFKKCSLFLSAFAFALSLSLHAKTVLDYEYPIEESFLATATAAVTPFLVDRTQFTSNLFERPSKVHQSFIDYPQREETPFFEGRHDYRTTFAYHKGETRPLVVILGGLGATSNNGTNKFLYHALHKAGYHVLSLGSPFFWRYNLGHVRDSTPGIAQRDSMDLYDLARRSLIKLQDRYRFKISKSFLVGFSLGGLESVFVSEIDKREKFFDFKKTLAINPPLSLVNSSKRLDDYYQTWLGLGKKGQSALESKKSSLIFRFSDSLDDFSMNDILGVLSEDFISSVEAQALLGKEFRDSLSETIFVSELVNRRGLFETFVGHFSPQPGLANAAKFGYMKYLKEVLLPYYQTLEPGITFEEMSFKLSLESKFSFMKNNPDLYIFHNLNDPIMSAKEIKKLERVVGPDRMTIFPHGGHIGNIWFEDNIERLLGILKSK